MATIRTKRFFQFKKIDVNGLSAVLALLKKGFTSWKYTLRYPTEDIEVNRFDDVKSIVATKGQARGWKLDCKSSGGRWACFDSLSSKFISIEFYSSQVNPDEPITAIQEALELIPLQRLIESVFIAHGFDDLGTVYANEVRIFFQELGIHVETGEYFEPESVPDKVKQRIEKCDIFVAIVNPQDDHTWIIQETSFAHSKEKQLIILVDHEANFKAGLLGDIEYIPFYRERISEGFVKILQGLNKIRGTI